MKTKPRVKRNSGVYGLTLALTFGAAACDYKGTTSSPVPSPVKSTVTESAIAPSLPTPSSVKSSLRPESDDATSRKLAQCEPPVIDGSTRQLQGRLAKWATCVSDLVKKEVQSLKSSGGRNPLDARRIESMVDSICGLTENAQSFDFRADRPLLIGSLVGFTDLDCSIKASTSIYKLLTLARSNPELLKSCLAERQRSGLNALALMEKRYASAKKHAGTTPPPFAVSDCKPNDCPPYVTGTF